MDNGNRIRGDELAWRRPEGQSFMPSQWAYLQRSLILMQDLV